MGLSSALVGQDLGSSNKTNWPWIIELVVAGILVLFFLFYFNRLFATIISYLARLYTWRTFRVWVDIQSIQISLLGGRLFFKGVRYHGENETILIQSGYITWRYWLRSVKRVDLTTIDNSCADDKFSQSGTSESSGQSQKDEEAGVAKKADNSQARIAVFVTGVEWFIYNRTPMYDAILKEASCVDNSRSADGANSDMKSPIRPTDKVKIPAVLRRRQMPIEQSLHDANTERNSTLGDSKGSKRTSASAVREKKIEVIESDSTQAQSLLVQILPVYIECNRAAVSMGNENTKALLVTTITKAKGYIGATGCAEPDIFRQLFDFDVEHPVVQMRSNPDFQASQLSTADNLARGNRHMPKRRSRWLPRFHFRRRKDNMLSTIYGLLPWLYSSTQSLNHAQHSPFSLRPDHVPSHTDHNEKQWHGLGRYLNENENDDHQAWSDIEYARFSTLLDCPQVHLNFYWDVPGKVKQSHLEGRYGLSKRDINGIDPPAYGLILTVKGGRVDYGPWADRLRVELQAMFLPASFTSAAAASMLSVGDWRQSTKMIIKVDIEDEVTLRVPMRERSKDWRWRGRATAVRDAAALRKQNEKRHFRFRRGQKKVLGPDIRPFGWLSFSVAADSNVCYEMDMVAGPSGYHNRLSLDLKETRVNSSVNHALLWKCNAQRLDCDLSNPLTWNGLHEWTFGVQSDSMQFFLLRDHMFLLIDLIDDFTAGQTSDYMTFVPFKYKLNLQFNDLQLFLNANDFNIVDNPCNKDSNAFLILGMRSLFGKVEIPMHYFSPLQSSVSFDAHGDDLYLNLNTPLWNTARNFSRDNTMATLRGLQLDGSYTYCTSTSHLLTDTLLMDIKGSDPKFYLEGALIRYFMNVRENYFGDYLHYKTLEEFQSSMIDGQPPVEQPKYQAKQDNDLDVILSVQAVESCVLIPAYIYDRSESVRVDIMNVDIDMRFTNYYMDLQISTSPVEIAIEMATPTSGQESDIETSNCQVYIDHVTLFGHRLFGAPPTEPTYVCNWDVDVGTIFGECSADFLRVTIAAIESLIYTLDDEQNALKSSQTSVLHDITFLHVQTAGLRIWLREQSTAFLLEVAPFDLLFDDWAKDKFSKQLRLSIPKVVLAAMDLGVTNRHGFGGHMHNSTIAYINTSVSVFTFDKDADFEQSRRLQQDHVWFHDLKSHRARGLMNVAEPILRPGDDVSWADDPPNLPVPALSIPILANASIVQHQVSYTTKRQVHVQDNEADAVQPSVSVDHNNSPNGFTSNRILSQGGENHTCNGCFPSNEESKRQHSDAPFVSAWLPPHFALQNLQPASDGIPGLTLPANLRTARENEAEVEDIPSENDASIKHGSTVIRFVSGIRGICHSELSLHVFRFLASVMKCSPVATLDAVERKALKNILQLTSSSINQVSDIAVLIPGLAFRLIDNGTNVEKGQPTSDHYNIDVGQLRLKLRTAPTATKQSQGQTRKDILLLHLLTENITLEVSDHTSSSSGSIPGIFLSLSSCSSWVSIQDRIRSDIQVGKLEIKTRASEVDKMALLFQRSALMIEKVTSEAKILQHIAYAEQLIHHLAVNVKDIKSPAFLSRPSNVLRNADDHVRFNRSWKILMILRHRLQSMPRSSYSELTRLQSPQEQGSDLRDVIMTALNEDSDMKSNVKVYEPFLQSFLTTAESETDKSATTSDIQISSFISQIALVLDHGVKKSEIVLEDCDFGFMQSPILSQEVSTAEIWKRQRSQIIINSWLSRIRVDLKWELIELAKSMIVLTQEQQCNSQGNRVPLNPPHLPEQRAVPSDVDISIVCGTDSALLRLTTVHLVHSLGAEKLRGSCMLLNNDEKSFLTLLLASESAHTRILSHATKLLQVQLSSPSIYAAHRHNLRDLAQADKFQIAAACSDLRLNLTEAPVGLLHVANLIIANEVSVIQEVVNLLHVQSDHPTSISKPAHRLPSVQIGLFLERYRLQLALLPTMQYAISGKIARTAIVPITHSKYTVHLDVKETRHTLMRPGTLLPDSKSILYIPPISGRVVLTWAKSNIKINARGVVGRIDVDAAAVQACAEAIFLPENSHYVETIKSAINDCKDTLQHKSALHKPREKTKVARSNDQQILYTVNLVSAGVAVNFEAPARQMQGSHANMNFEIRWISFGACNFNRNSVLDFPNLKINVPDIRLSLYRKLGPQRYDAGKLQLGFQLGSSQNADDAQGETQNYRARVNGINLDLFTGTPAIALDIAAYIEEQLRSMSNEHTISKIQPLKRLTVAHNEMKKKRLAGMKLDNNPATAVDTSTILQNSVFILEVGKIQARWILDDATPISPGRKVQDLVFSIRNISLTTQREDSARLSIVDLQLQMAPKDQSDPTGRTRNSALLPEVVFKAAHVSTKKDRKFAFQAAGKALDLRLATDGILPLVAVQNSLTKASAELRSLQQQESESAGQPQSATVSSILGNKTLSSLLVDADFAGAVLSITPRIEPEQESSFGLLKGPKRARTGRYGQAVRSSDTEEATLRAPGIAMKVEYQDAGVNEPSLSMEMKVAASNNTLAPPVVPLILDIYSSVKEVMGEGDPLLGKSELKAPAQKYLSDAANNEVDPTAVLGRLKLNATLWVQRQEFSLTCQPIARVQATTAFNDIFVTVNTVNNEEQGRFVSVLTKFNHLQASVQHVYSRESTASFEVETIVMSLMNSKHVSAKNGISAILNISPMSTNINARQLQDFLLFREIWYPEEIRRASKPNTPAPAMSESQSYAMQRYQELTATAALPWHAVVSIQELKMQIDFGQALGKSSFTIIDLWASSKKKSDWEQNLCIGFKRVGIDSTGRMSGVIELRNFRGRTSITWPISTASGVRAPLVQGSLSFDHLRVKTAFDYQPFAVANVSSFEFLMYNDRPDGQRETDRLVAILNGGKVQAFCISAAGGQVLAIIQAFERLFQEKKDAYEASLHEVERLLKRKSVFPTASHLSASIELEPTITETEKTRHALHTDVIVTLNAIDIGAFPNTFFDNQILKIQAADAQARFAVAADQQKIKSVLSLNLGQVRLALSSVGRSATKALGEVEIDEVIERAMSSRGGTIIKVPRLVASMQTWQQEKSNLIEYIFRSTFQGKVDVGWNYSRISFIRGMWDTHSQAMAQRLGKPLSPSAVKITAEDVKEGSGQEKITAVVNMPQSSKYEYIALEPPIVDTPQLRDMGEATPPLEWIGLHRDKLPNVTHSIIIVTLLEVAREVEDAYTRILGTG